MAEVWGESRFKDDFSVLFGDEDDVFGAVVGGGQLEEFGVSELVHDGHLLVDLVAVGRLDAAHVLGGPHAARALVHQPVDDAEAALAQLLVHAVLVLH